MRALNQMGEQLAGTVGDVARTADSIRTAPAEIASGNQDLQLRTGQTTSRLEVTSSSMAQPTGTVHQRAGHAQTANQLATSAADVAHRGQPVPSAIAAQDCAARFSVVTCTATVVARSCP